MISAGAKRHSYASVQKYTGHGIGRQFHDSSFPRVLHYDDKGRSAHSSFVLKPGMTLTIEPMLNAGGSPDVVVSQRHHHAFSQLLLFANIVACRVFLLLPYTRATSALSSRMCYRYSRTNGQWSPRMDRCRRSGSILSLSRNMATVSSPCG